MLKDISLFDVTTFVKFREITCFRLLSAEIFFLGRV